MADESIAKLIISNEDQAWEALRLALAGEVSETTQVIFEGWPVFKLTISGADFNASIPTRIMPPILELQKEIYRVYCQAVYNTEDSRCLKDDERALLELVVDIRPGSTEFITELFKALNEVIKNSNMNGRQVLILLISIAGMTAGTIGWKAWVSAKEREHGQAVTVQLSQQETERMQIFADALRHEPAIEKNTQAINQFRDSLAKKLQPADQISVESLPVITGVRAAEIVPAPRAVAEPIRIDGEFVINDVKFPKNFGGEYRFSVTRVIDSKQITVTAAPGTLTDAQIQILKDGGFEVKRVRMEINARILRDTISSATLLSIGWPEE